MILQLSNGQHLRSYYRRNWLFRKYRVWSLYAAVPGLDDKAPVIRFEAMEQGLRDDDMHEHLIAASFPPQDVTLFAKVLGHAAYKAQAPVWQLKRIQAELEQLIRRAA